jgi:hypothetical protein
MPNDGDRIDTTKDAAAERLGREHPAKPEQSNDEGFEQGYDQHRDTPEEQLEPNYARGISAEPPEGERHGRFSTGHEETPDTPEKEVERRFSEGIEQSPTSD